MSILNRMRRPTHDGLEQMLDGLSGTERMATVEGLDDPVILGFAAEHADVLVRAGVARSAATPVELHARLAHDPDWMVRQLVAENFSTPPDVLIDLARTERNPEVLRALADSDRLTVRLAVTENPSLTGDVVSRLADGPPTLRIAAVAHESASEDVLASAVADPSEAVRQAAAGNPHLTEDQVRQLAADPSEHVRLALGAAHGTTAERWVTDRLAETGDAVRDVDRWFGAFERAVGEKWTGIREGLHAADERHMAEDRATVGGAITHILAEFDSGAEVILARATGYMQARSLDDERRVEATPTDVLVREQEPSWASAVEVEEAYDRATDDARLAELATSSNSRVRSAVARNSGVSPSVLDDLAEDAADDVRQAAEWSRVLRAARPSEAMKAPTACM